MEGKNRRRFNKSEKIAAFLSQDGLSSVSGKPLGSDFHADHRIPWSKGGATTVENCDAMTPDENLSKGAKMVDRFIWQDEFIQKYLEHAEPNFFLCALPGAGKTRASRRVINEWVSKGGVVVIVAPSLPIKRNWHKTLEDAKIYIDEVFYGFIKEGRVGVCTTYQQLRAQSQLYKRLCSKNSVLLICDEIHHASEHKDSTWGADLKESFSLAKRRLMLSGTPVRSDKECTTFLTIEDDPDNLGSHRYKMDYLYDWPRALSDRVVRSVTFHRISMAKVNVEYAQRGIVTYMNDDDPYLSYALDDQKFLHTVLRSANDKLNILRLTDNSAAGMAVAKNISHAKKVYDCLEQLGQNPIIVTSEEEENSVDVIEYFKGDNSKKWIVSVQQVSEGVDIPRLRVLAYLTNYATELAFRQLVGRVVRRRDFESDSLATAQVFIPEVPKLTKYADTIEKLQALVFKKAGPNDPPTKSEMGITIGGSQPEFVGYIIHGQHYVGDRVAVIHQLMKIYKANEETASLMLDNPTFAHGIKIGEPNIENKLTDEMHPRFEEGQLNADCKDLTKRLTKIRMKREGYTHYEQKSWGKIAKKIHREFMIDGLNQKKLSVNQLKRKKDSLLQAIMREQKDAQ